MRRLTELVQRPDACAPCTQGLAIRARRSPIGNSAELVPALRGNFVQLQRKYARGRRAHVRIEFTVADQLRELAVEVELEIFKTFANLGRQTPHHQPLLLRHLRLERLDLFGKRVVLFHERPILLPSMLRD